MVEMNVLNSAQLIEAVRVWTGWGQSAMPSRSDQRLADQFGEDATKLLPLIKSLEDDFDVSDARLTAVNLEEMEKLASDQFRQKHPAVAEEIVKAFARCYTFDFK
ncbi:hypothetical protein FTW19_08290 [Terriglobus albidus]|uniref:Uncharacterized protein n=1 Tax=Terriglobus albidus TaxID=1592106 RepID=A0A5B9E6X2_9BACT|nr:hypothetical protein [Terriglobus albidus]QEE27993.1 hypothetical protein FTW19_08290 [Terriglobus albidus]